MKNRPGGFGVEARTLGLCGLHWPFEGVLASCDMALAVGLHGDLGGYDCGLFALFYASRRSSCESVSITVC
jgi:hypothetical protein